IVKAINKAEFKVSEVKNGTRKKNSPLPFTTSTLQQEASKVLGFSTQKTMRIAQSLYEGVNIGKNTVGIITYLRTDSVRVSDEAVKNANDYINKHYGKEYINPNEQAQKSGKKIQDAHEAIRPTDLTRTPEMIKDYLQRDEYRLYSLIYKRFLASRMAPCVFDTVATKINAGEYTFKVSASKIAFDGYRAVYTSDEDEKDDKNALVNKLDKKTKLKLNELQKEQHFTQPPAHFTEAGLVKAMEEQGIGRPSTYAPTITTIMARHYVVKENKNLYVSELGEVVNNMMEEAFPTIVDVNFTANMEALLDAIEEGNVQWKTVVANFYPDLDEAVNKATKELEHVKVEDEVSDVTCDLCGRKMVFKFGPHGKFLACPGFPECRNTKSYLEKIGVACPKCGKDIVIRKTKKGRTYYGCEGGPECDYMSWQRPLKDTCPKCNYPLIKRGNKFACSNDKCDYIK
ncbi:MAG: type I DNA topoisomerase, partial [Lachnospiraceae bacterium]|nr:type I DNA topoisomerase [Lachnospiraceae bacterium]